MEKVYAIIEKNEKVTYYEGKLYELEGLDELQGLRNSSEYPLVFVNPFRTIRERGSRFQAKGEEPILVIEADIVKTFAREQFLENLKRKTQGQIIELREEIKPSVSDEEFSRQVQQIKDEEISGGNVSQVVLSRKFHGQIKNMNTKIYHLIYMRLLKLRGQYMTFLFNNADKYAFIGASPECHIRIQDGEVTMNPIAGTLKKSNSTSSKKELENFLKDPKEINELFQVLDEELKMMAKICPRGGKIVGPKLRETGAVIHTEYELVGKNDGSKKAIEILRETLHAPTLTGSPIESAGRIINHYEGFRVYYGGQYGVYKSNGDLDSAIFIRTARLLINGEFMVQAGAGIVKDSIPLKEAEETRAKANGFLNALKDTRVGDNYLTEVNPAWLENLLKKRNAHLSSFHLERQTKHKKATSLKGLRVMIVNNEDNFALILAHMAGHLGCQAEVVDTFQFNLDEIESDIIILGPGPGDINDINNPRMIKLLLITEQLVNRKIPVLGVCLGHQALGRVMGMAVVKHELTMQGVHAQEKLFGKPEYLGFYNSFFVESETPPSGVEICRDKKSRIIAMRSEKIISLQFHPESIMTKNGHGILMTHLQSLTNNIKR